MPQWKPQTNIDLLDVTPHRLQSFVLSKTPPTAQLQMAGEWKKKISEKTLHFISLHTELTTDGVGCARSSFFNVLSEPTSAKNFRALMCVFFLKTVFSRFTFRRLFVLKTSRTLPEGSDSLLPSPLTSHPDICSIRSRSLIVVDMTHESNHSHTPTISWWPPLTANSHFPTRDILSRDLRWFWNHHLVSVFRWHIGTWHVWVLLCVYWHSVKLEWCSQIWTKLMSMTSSKHQRRLIDSWQKKSCNLGFLFLVLWCSGCRGTVYKVQHRKSKVFYNFHQNDFTHPQNLLFILYIFHYFTSKYYCHESALVSKSTAQCPTFLFNHLWSILTRVTWLKFDLLIDGLGTPHNNEITEHFRFLCQPIKSESHRLNSCLLLLNRLWAAIEFHNFSVDWQQKKTAVYNVVQSPDHSPTIHTGLILSQWTDPLCLVEMCRVICGGFLRTWLIRTWLKSQTSSAIITNH